MAGDEARLVGLSIRQVDAGSAAFRLETPFGENVQVMPRPPAFRAQVTLAWEGAMPEEVAALVARARAAGLRIECGN